jgi:hypothetical protein
VFAHEDWGKPLSNACVSKKEKSNNERETVREREREK